MEVTGQGHFILQHLSEPAFRVAPYHRDFRECLLMERRTNHSWQVRFCWRQAALKHILWWKWNLWSHHILCSPFQVRCSWRQMDLNWSAFPKLCSSLRADCSAEHREREGHWSNCLTCSIFTLKMSVWWPWSPNHFSIWWVFKESVLK